MTKFTHKIKIMDGHILYDEDQIAFFLDHDDDQNEICLCLSEKDLDNAEMPEEKKKEILDNKDEIIFHLTNNLGLVIVEGLD